MIIYLVVDRLCIVEMCVLRSQKMYTADIKSRIRGTAIPTLFCGAFRGPVYVKVALVFVVRPLFIFLLAATLIAQSFGCAHKPNNYTWACSLVWRIFRAIGALLLYGGVSFKLLE